MTRRAITLTDLERGALRSLVSITLESNDIIAQCGDNAESRREQATLHRVLRKLDAADLTTQPKARMRRGMDTTS